MTDDEKREGDEKKSEGEDKKNDVDKASDSGGTPDKSKADKKKQTIIAIAAVASAIIGYLIYRNYASNASNATTAATTTTPASTEGSTDTGGGGGYGGYGSNGLSADIASLEASEALNTASTNSVLKGLNAKLGLITKQNQKTNQLLSSERNQLKTLQQKLAKTSTKPATHPVTSKKSAPIHKVTVLGVGKKPAPTHFGL